MSQTQSGRQLLSVLGHKTVSLSFVWYKYHSICFKIVEIQLGDKDSYSLLINS